MAESVRLTFCMCKIYTKWPIKRPSGDMFKNPKKVKHSTLGSTYGQIPDASHQ